MVGISVRQNYRVYSVDALLQKIFKDPNTRPGVNYDDVLTIDA
jgi:hypothetical protein